MNGKLAERQDWMNDRVYEWACLEEQARLNSLGRYYAGGKKAMIAIKAQDPLNPDGTPGREYTFRLEKALAVRRDLEVQGLRVEFATFGGVHKGCASTTLAEAGRNWLIDHGVRAEAIESFGTVFSGNDEDRLAAEKFAKDEGYAQLHVVMSAGQWDRARFYYIFCGWQPEFHTVTFLETKPRHSSVCEMWGGWAMPSFAAGVEAVEQETEKIRQRHLAEAK